MSNVVGNLTKEQFDAELQKGINDIENGQVYSADSVEEELKRMYHLPSGLFSNTR